MIVRTVMGLGSIQGNRMLRDQYGMKWWRGHDGRWIRVTNDYRGPRLTDAEMIQHGSPLTTIEEE